MAPEAQRLRGRVKAGQGLATRCFRRQPKAVGVEEGDAQRALP